MTEIFNCNNFSKCIIQEKAWENMKCSKCNVLLVDDHQTDEVDFKVCPVCGEKVARIKKINIEEV